MGSGGLRKGRFDPQHTEGRHRTLSTAAFPPGSKAPPETVSLTDCHETRLLTPRFSRAPRKFRQDAGTGPKETTKDLVLCWGPRLVFSKPTTLSENCLKWSNAGRNNKQVTD